MAENGISTLATKEERQLAKLELAQTKRQQEGTPGYRNLRYYDIDLLPTKYNGNAVVYTPHPTGLVQGRPWSTAPSIVSGLWSSVYNGYFGDNGILAQETDVQWFDTQTPIETTAVTDFTYFSGIAQSVQWLGYFKAPHTANYTFDATGVDDELYFWIGNKAITAYTAANADVYNNTTDSNRQVSEPIALTAGEYYPVRMQWGNSTGGGEVVFGWSDDQDITTAGMVLWLQSWVGWDSPFTWTNKLDGDFPGLYNATTLNYPTGEPNLLPVLVMQFTSGNYWEVANPTTGDFTVGVWFNTTDTDGTGLHYYDNPSLVGSDTSGIANDWGFCIRNGQIGFGGVSGQTAFTTGQFNDGQWHYAVAVRIQTTGSMTVFVDGVQRAQIIEAPGHTLTDTDTIRIGADPTNGTPYNGYLAEVQFYQVALTSAQIASNFLIQRGIYGV